MAVEVFIVGVDVVGWEEDGAASEAVLTAFMEDLALPSSVRGPVLCCALARLALRRASEALVSGLLVQVVPCGCTASV